MKRKLTVNSIINLSTSILVLSATIVSSILYVSASEGIKERSINSINNQAEDLYNEFDNLYVNLLEISNKISNLNDVKLLKSYYFDKNNDSFGKIEALNSLDESLDTFNFLSSFVLNAAAYIKPLDDLSYGIRHVVTTSNPSTNVDHVILNYSFFNAKDNTLIYNDSLFFVFSDDNNDTLKIAVELNVNELNKYFSISGSPLGVDGSFHFVNNYFVCSIANYSIETSEILNENFAEIANASKYTKYKRYNESIYIRYSLDLWLVNSYFNLPIVYFVIGILLLISLFFLTLYIQNIVMKKPIREIQKALAAISNGDFGYRIKYSTKSELQEVFNGINNTADMLGKYINEHYIQEIQVKDANFKVLQSQIHPHFLYNCFATIQSLIKLNEYEKAAVLTKELSLYYSYITKNKRMLVSLKEEWGHMIRYLTIQKIRFEDNVTYDIKEIDDKFSSYTVPKVIFQPIVENCFKYAFKTIDDGHLKITFYEENDYFYIVFEDNGRITDEEIISLNKKIHDESIEISGLINVAQRVLNYSQGKNSVIIKRSEELKGLNITFKFEK